MFTLGSVISVPSNVIVPPVGSSRRFRHRRNVDLPDPDGPITTTTSPRWMSALTPFSALILLPVVNTFSRFRT